MTMRLRALISAAAVAALAAANAGAADIEAGKKKVQEVCAACHGIDGGQPTTPEYPKLSGQYPDYLAKALRDYKSGARKNPVMSAMAAGLTPKDIDNVSAYFASQAGPLRAVY